MLRISQNKKNTKVSVKIPSKNSFEMFQYWIAQLLRNI
jgi:hypothetical protein